MTKLAVDKLFQDEGKRQVMCHCSKIGARYSGFYNHFELPQYKVCDITLEKYDIKKCLKYDTMEEAGKAGLPCTPGLTKDTQFDTEYGIFGTLDSGSSTKVMQWLHQTCEASKDLLRGIKDTALATAIDDRDTLVTKDALMRRLKAQVMRTFQTVQPLWSTQLHAGKASEAFKSPSVVLRMSKEDCSATEASNQACMEGGKKLDVGGKDSGTIDGYEYVVASGFNDIVGDYVGGNKFGVFMGDFGGGFSLNWNDTLHVADEPTYGYGHVLKGIIDRAAETEPWLVAWKAMYEMGTEQENWGQAYAYMYMDIKKVVDDETEELKMDLDDVSYQK